MKYFTEDELKCPTTGQFKLQDGFGDALDALREEFNQSMIITSGCRTDEHNEWLQGRGYPASSNSFHLIDNKVALNRNFSVGIAKTFIHIDLRTAYTNLPQVVYSY